jgi:hypothetical protein
MDESQGKLAGLILLLIGAPLIIYGLIIENDLGLTLILIWLIISIIIIMIYVTYTRKREDDKE